MRENALIIVAKQPVEGRCKTRLAKTIGHATATKLYEYFLFDIRDKLVRDLREQCDVIVAFTPESDPQYFEKYCPTGWRIMPQVGEDLGERLSHAVREVLGRGYKRVVVMSTDSPDLPIAYILSAFNRLLDHDAVLGPCEDGGYYLIGMRRDIPHLFHDITWSTEWVAEQTICRARECGAMLAMLPVWYDVDGEQDLKRLIMSAYHPNAEAGAEIPSPIAQTLHFIQDETLLTSRLDVAHLTGSEPRFRSESTSYAEERWHRTSTKHVYRNPWTDLREDIVRLPDGRETVYGVVTFGECVGVLPMLDERTVVLIRQYRYVQGDFFWEMPTGGVSPNESPVEAATRELREETGYSANNLIPLQSFQTSKSVCRETAHLFLGTGLNGDPLQPDETEFFRVEAFSLDKAVLMVKRGMIMDSMTVIAVYAALRELKER